MANKKPVNGRTYPFIYNLTMAVGAYKSVQEVTYWVDPVMPYFRNKERSGDLWPMKVSERTSTTQPNKRDDVMLVQYLLKRIYQKGSLVNPPLSQSSGAAFLAIDGWHGPKTQGAIEHYQLEMRRNGRNIAVDGCVDPEPGDSGFSTISQTAYTITWLNKYLWTLYPELAPDITRDPECPPELAWSIR